MPAPTAPKAETLPKFNVAALVPAPDDKATPATSELKTRLMDEFTVAVTVNVPLAVFPACAAANDDARSSIAIVAIVYMTSFFIVVPLS
jgi:hypothetical protein